MTRTAVLVFVLLASSVSLLAPWSSAAKATFYDVDYKVDPLLAGIANVTNLGDPTQDLPTTIAEWQRDLGDEVMPNGTYWGTLMPGARFVNNYERVWDPDSPVLWWDPVEGWYNGLSVGGLGGRFSYILAASHFRWTSTVLMSGCSSWWVRLPVSPQSMERVHGLVVGIFHGETNASACNLLTDYRSNSTWMRPTIAGRAPDEYVYVGFDKSGWGEPALNVSQGGNVSELSTGSGAIAGDRLYLQVNSILRPDTDYVISVAFRMPDEGPGLTTYWAASESPCGNWSHIELSEFRLTGSGGAYYETYTMDELGNTSMDVPMDLDWSFIFVEGIGAGGLFGKKIVVDSNATLTLYPFVNTSRSGHQHMSFMWPFISHTNLSIEPEIHQAIGSPRGAGPGFIHHVWAFDDMSYEFDPDIYYNYSDFVLFSSSVHLRWGASGYQFTEDDRWNVRVDLNLEGNIPADLNWTNLTSRHYEFTVLCYERVRPPVMWSTVNESLAWNTSRLPWARPHLDRTDSSTYFYYEVWCSARGTDGQWAMQTGTVSGMPVYTYHFPQVIYIDAVSLKITSQMGEKWIGLSQKDGFYSQIQDWWGEHYFGEALRTKFYEPMQLFGPNGLIMNKLSEIWDFFIGWGKWFYAGLVQFVGQIITFAQDVFDAITGIVWTLRSLVAPVAMMSIVSIGARLNNKLLVEA